MDNPLKPFVIIFRQGARELTEAELKSRSEETRAWAQVHNSAGHKLAPHILAPESYRSGPSPASRTDVITALLFLAARNLDEAVAVAQVHPGVRYGASIEVRPWASPPAPPPAAPRSP
ncbi:hypothetical protein [Hyalangium versicolor]|uniref:hypothetical protein n=1 Tax=Hyalangium versicolor TaxID=2861190 RepID=UPI001CCCC2BA|nr:hypothetical protein [Hyalangium versicolor]